MAWPQNHDDTPAHLLDSDREAGFEISPDYSRFSQMNDIFTRAFWDDAVRSAHSDGFFASYRMEAAPRRGEGFQAPLRSDTPVAAERAELGTPQDEATGIKRIARLFGADLVGITHLDLRWHYADRPDPRDMTPVPNDLPEGLSHVIVMGHAMDFDLVDTYPSALAGHRRGGTGRCPAGAGLAETPRRSAPPEAA